MSKTIASMKQTDSEAAMRRYHELLDGLSTTEGLQLPSSGYGKLVHRRYSIEFTAVNLIAKFSSQFLAIPTGTATKRWPRSTR